MMSGIKEFMINKLEDRKLSYENENFKEEKK